jgi:hypothetical protein
MKFFSDILRYNYLNNPNVARRFTALEENSLEGTINGRLYDHIKGLCTFQYKQTCSTPTCPENRIVKINKYTLQQRYSDPAPEKTFSNFLTGKV